MNGADGRTLPRLSAGDYGVQTWGVLVAAYRDLNARKLFWVALVLNALVVAAIATVGVDQKGVTVLGFELAIPGVNSTTFPEGKLYKLILAGLGVGFWLSWLSTILALMSTASIFPDLASGGVDTMLSKPIGRTRLFLTKFTSGLLFTALQVTVFAVLGFFMLGFRGGAWEPGLFVVVPLMVVFFSYLFCVQAVVGMVTRSPIASVIVTLLFWIFIFLVHSGEQFTLIGSTASRLEIAGIEKKLATLSTDEAKKPLLARLDEQRATDGNWKLAHGIFYTAMTTLPKTTETVNLVARELALRAEIGEAPADDAAQGDDENARRQRGFFRSQFVRERDLRAAVADEMESRSVLWVVGTSMGFVGVTLGFGAWYFRRRDF